MLEINWKQDYHGEFTCPTCEKSQLNLGGRNSTGQKKLKCPNCKIQISTSLKLSSQSRYLKLKQKDRYINTNWEQDYHNEFTCPLCNKSKLNLGGANRRGKRELMCPNCKNVTLTYLGLNDSSKYLQSKLKNKHIDWEKDYHGEFTCPLCEESRLNLGGANGRGKMKFTCPNCKKNTLESLDLCGRSKYLNLKLKDEHIDWERDYHGEFVCPECNAEGMTVWGINKTTLKRQFFCLSCKKIQYQSRTIDEIKMIEDPVNPGITWYTNHRLDDFICTNCQERNIYIHQIDNVKKRFKCRTCKKIQYDSIVLVTNIVSRFNQNSLPVKAYKWEDDEWDLRAISPNFDERDRRHYFANFGGFELDWFKCKIKEYICCLCKLGTAFATIQNYLYCLKPLSIYLDKSHVSGFDEINRDLFLDYIVSENHNITQKLVAARKFFTAGTIQGWFNINQDIIRDADYPKRHQGNPDPMSNSVRKQIEENLHLLPDPIARMWLICYFAAMRPSELSLLNQNCLIQEGQHWKIVWRRKKGKDQHEIPISRNIAKVVQEQQEYIKNLWGDSWKYLFCHYQGLSFTDPLMPKLEAVKKVLPAHDANPLLMGIRTLIIALDIKDENGQPAKFHENLLRPTRLTELFEQGHDLAVVSAWAGHKQLATTSTYYTQVSCELMEREAGHIQKALVNSNGYRVLYESYPKSFWENPTAHKLELGDTHINTPIYGYCGLPLDQDCHKFRACYTCQSFVATIDKLPEYINVRDELRGKQAKAMSAGQEVLVEQFGTQADRLDEIVAGLHQEAT
ncbi:tyrosine-type recombinase/integrase [Chamaesiphon polymorphus]|uniref:tyrosine-type recombinase/integrase n=1 Tax=Chamaesiphon polymorphus TaxID=2107691 RepID=UPI001FE72A31|nr:tyrosine-type recombinase/integrase [Chamaesiphon polymorphus]